MYDQVRAIKTGFTRRAASLTRFVSVATGARRKDKRGIPERSCKALARSEALSVKA